MKLVINVEGTKDQLDEIIADLQFKHAEYLMGFDYKWVDK